MRKAITILVISLLSCINAMAVQSGKCGDNATWILSDDSVLTISGTGEIFPLDNIITKAKEIIIETGITNISNHNVFSWNNSVTSISIPNSLTKFNGNEFNLCEKLMYNSYDNAWYLGNEENPYLILIKAKSKSITQCAINERCKDIANSAFEDCVMLEEINIPNSIKKIGNYAFYNCKDLKKISISESVAHIGDFAFKKCARLTSVSIPNKIKQIGDGVFEGCINLEYVLLPDTIYCIGQKAFDGCARLKSIRFSKHLYSIGERAFTGCKELCVEIPENILTINESTYEGCHNLMEIPHIIFNIKERAFANCIGLKNIAIETEEIEKEAFRDCTELDSVSFYTQNLGEGAFEGCTKLKKVTILKSLTEIKDNTFKNCKELTNISIPNSVVKIGFNAFDNCDSLNYNRYDSLCYIGNEENRFHALIHPESDLVTECQINEECDIVADGAFVCHYRLKKVSIPEHIKRIGNSPFFGCLGLTTIICNSPTPPVIGCNNLGDFINKPTLYVPKESIKAYKKADGWRNFKKIKAIESLNKK